MDYPRFLQQPWTFNHESVQKLEPYDVGLPIPFGVYPEVMEEGGLWPD
jgi:hypothetical protein